MSSLLKSPRSTVKKPILMTPEQIAAHLRSYRERLDRIASEERAREERETAIFRENCDSCRKALEERVEPLLQRLSEILAAGGHESVLHPTQESEHTTQRTKLRSVEYATAIAVERPKGALILRIVATPQNMQISALIGVPHGNCSSVFHVTDGPPGEAEEVTNRGIADFMISAFPLR